jgi:hypothetical protein
MSLRERIATPDGKRRFVRAIFATIADRYDFITVILSYGQDRRWKDRLIDLAAPRQAARALDLALAPVTSRSRWRPAAPVSSGSARREG